MARDLIIGIHPDRVGKESYSEKMSKYLKDRGVQVRFLNLLAQDALDQARQCDGVIWRWSHNPQDKQSAQRILYTIEHYLGIPVYPNTYTSWHFDEKVAEHYLLQALNAPMPKAWIFWDMDEALDWSRSAPYPVVFKLSSGAGSSNVLKIDNQAEAEHLINRIFRRGIFPYTMNEFRSPAVPRSPSELMSYAGRSIDAFRYIVSGDYPRLHSHWWKPEHSYAYFQEFLSGNEFDTRVTIIGNRAFVIRRFNRPGDFRASGSGIRDFDPSKIDLRCVKIAFEVSKAGKFQSMNYDFLYRDNEPVICEISYSSPAINRYESPGHWNSDLKWIDGHMWPEEALVIDFLNKIESASQK